MALVYFLKSSITNQGCAGDDGPPDAAACVLFIRLWHNFTLASEFSHREFRLIWDVWVKQAEDF